MPRRDPSAYVWDVLDACRTIEEGLRGVGRQQYVGDKMRRLAIERLLINAGEALVQLDRLDAVMAAELGEVGKIVAFRNVLVHGYYKLDHELVWDVLMSHVPALRAAAEKVWARFAPLYEKDVPET